MSQTPLKPRRALISVSNKSGIVEFASGLHKAGVEILSTGGTAKLLSEQDIPVTEVSSYTGFPEMMDGRVKTCLLYTSPSPRDLSTSRMPSSA